MWSCWICAEFPQNLIPAPVWVILYSVGEYVLISQLHLSFHKSHPWYTVCFAVIYLLIQMSRDQHNVINPGGKPDLGNLVGLQLNTLGAHILPNRKRSWQSKWTELVFPIAGKSFYITYSHGAWSAQLRYCIVWQKPVSSQTKANLSGQTSGRECCTLILIIRS